MTHEQWTIGEKANSVEILKIKKEEATIISTLRAQNFSFYAFNILYY